MKSAWVSRLYPSAGSIAVLATVLFLCGSELYADDVPSLQKENGPYMVLARVFRGPEAERRAKATDIRVEAGKQTARIHLSVAEGQ